MGINSMGYWSEHDEELLTQLSWITSAELMQIFLEPKHHKSLPNIPTPTLGGKQLWDTLWEKGGWKVQKCRVLGTVLPHYRILNPQNIRKAWYFSYKQFLHDVVLFANEIRQKLIMQDFRYGIVFSGGGGKGAYEIGVWKYLHEIGVDKKVTGVSGASVGALNSLLFLQGDYKKAEDLWRNVRQGDFTNVNLLEYLQTLAQRCLDAAGMAIGGPVYLLLKALIENLQNDPEKSRNLSFSVFSQEKLRKKIDAYVCKDQVIENLSHKIVYSMLLDIATGAYPCCWNKRDFDNIRELVLTSAAMPLAYPKRLFDGRECLDGGIADNIPVRPLMEKYHHIIVIHLQPKGKKESESWIRSILGIKTADHNFYHVYPSSEKHMSNLQDTLTITPEITQYRIKLGYDDAKEQLTDLIAHENNQMPVPNAAQIHAILPSLRAEW